MESWGEKTTFWFSLLLFSQILKMLSGPDVPTMAVVTLLHGVLQEAGQHCMPSWKQSECRCLLCTHARVLSAFYSWQTQHCRDIKKDSCVWDQAVTLTGSRRWILLIKAIQDNRQENNSQALALCGQWTTSPSHQHHPIQALIFWLDNYNRCPNTFPPAPQTFTK